jgi:hypothetical protein
LNIFKGLRSTLDEGVVLIGGLMLVAVAMLDFGLGKGNRWVKETKTKGREDCNYNAVLLLSSCCSCLSFTFLLPPRVV